MQGIPPEFDIPAGRQYEYMAHLLMKQYGLSKEQAWNMTEYDYNLMICFNNIDTKKQNYIDAQKRG